MINTKDRQTIINKIQNKRILGIDFGLQRVGLAVCDPMHIVVTPKITLEFQNSNFWTQLLDFITNEKIEIIIVGVPYSNNSSHDKSIIPDIEIFIEELKQQTALEIFQQDESFTSKKASQIMIEIGTKKKKRSKKGSLDKVAAAIILQNFIDEYN